MSKRTTFADELKQWRGTRSQSVAAKVLRVNKRTLQGWEGGRSPALLEMVRFVMQMNPDLS